MKIKDNTKAEGKHWMHEGCKVQFRQIYLVQRTTFSPVELTLLFLAHTVASVTRCCCCSSSFCPRQAVTALCSSCSECGCTWKQLFAFDFNLLSGKFPVRPVSSVSNLQSPGDRALQPVPSVCFPPAVPQPSFASGFPSRGKDGPSNSFTPGFVAWPKTASLSDGSKASPLVWHKLFPEEELRSVTSFIVAEREDSTSSLLSPREASASPCCGWFSPSLTLPTVQSLVSWGSFRVGFCRCVHLGSVMEESLSFAVFTTASWTWLSGSAAFSEDACLPETIFPSRWHPDKKPKQV